MVHAALVCRMYFSGTDLATMQAQFQSSIVVAIPTDATIIITTFACEYRGNVDLTKQTQGDEQMP